MATPTIERFTDDFTGSENTGLAAHDPSWTVHAGTPQLNAANQLKNAAAPVFYASVAVTTDDQAARYEQFSSTSGYLLVRYDGASGNGYLAGFNAGKWIIFRMTGGGFTELTRSFANPPTLPATITLEAVGSEITLYDGAVARLSTTDATYGSGAVGVRGDASKDPVCDNFVALDDGTPGGGGGITVNPAGVDAAPGLDAAALAVRHLLTTDSLGVSPGLATAALAVRSRLAPQGLAAAAQLASAAAAIRVNVAPHVVRALPVLAAVPSGWEQAPVSMSFMASVARRSLAASVPVRTCAAGVPHRNFTAG